MAKKEHEKEQEEVVEVQAEEIQHVVSHLDRDPNDPRVQNPTVDGNTQPKVDINEPL